METWSDSPVHQSYCVRFFLDTNVLVYLVDNSYQPLVDFVEILKELPFVELVSSRYVIFEFVGIRKREHYLRIAAEKSRTGIGGDLNFSAILKYKNEYEFQGAKFEDVSTDIQTRVNKEVEKIATDYGIDFEYSSCHEEQFHPAFDLCLASKIDNADCLILVSAVLPHPQTTHSNIVLLTNDQKFERGFKSAKFDQLHFFQSISPPLLLHLDTIKVSKTAKSLSLLKPIDKDALRKKINEIILVLIQNQLSHSFLGVTFKPTSKKLPKNCVCFKLVENFHLPQNAYVTVMSRDLDFIYTGKRRVEAFWHNSRPVKDDYKLPENKENNISFLIEDVDDSGNPKPIDQQIVDRIKAEGNLVFIHPDSFV